MAFQICEQNATTWDRKFQLFQWTVFGPMYFNQSLRGSSSLNIDGISKRAIYSESVNKMLQHAIEKSKFFNGRFNHLCKPTKL